MFRIVEDRTDRGVKYYRLVFNENFVEIREDMGFEGVKHQLEGFIALCEKNARKADPPGATPISEVLVSYDLTDGQGNVLYQTFDRYPNCTFEVNRAGVCKIYDADKKLIASVRGWKKVSYA